MANDFLQFIGLVLGIASSILGVISFWRDKIVHRKYYIVGAIILGIITALLYSYTERKQHEIEVAQVKEAALQRDARVTSEGIVISGWEDTGDYVGYLSQITSFYRRHSELYQSEFETYSRQLQEWQDTLKRAREAKESLYSSDTRDLKGLVRSGKDHLTQISKKTD